MRIIKIYGLIKRFSVESVLPTLSNENHLYENEPLY